MCTLREVFERGKIRGFAVDSLDDLARDEIGGFVDFVTAVVGASSTWTLRESIERGKIKGFAVVNLLQPARDGKDGFVIVASASSMWTWRATVIVRLGRLPTLLRGKLKAPVSVKTRGLTSEALSAPSTWTLREPILRGKIDGFFVDGPDGPTHNGMYGGVVKSPCR